MVSNPKVLKHRRPCKWQSYTQMAASSEKTGFDLMKYKE